MAYNLDALFIATNAPGRSAFNRIERRMAPLSHELSGVILPHDHFGSHLDSQRRTIDDALELKNFQYAGEVLAEVWRPLVVDGHPTVAEYIRPDESEIPVGTIQLKSQSWMDRHVRTSQYFTQVVKCEDLYCCSPARSSYFKIIDGQFLPPPLPITYSSSGLTIPNPSSTFRNVDPVKYLFPKLAIQNMLNIDRLIPSEASSFRDNIPYDLFCPSVKSTLRDRMCKHCNHYFASKIMLQHHVSSEHKRPPAAPAQRIRPQRIAAKRQRELMIVIAEEENAESIEWLEEDEVDSEGLLPLEIGQNLIDLPEIPISNIAEGGNWIF